MRKIELHLKRAQYYTLAGDNRIIRFFQVLKVRNFEMFPWIVESDKYYFKSVKRIGICSVRKNKISINIAVQKNKAVTLLLLFHEILHAIIYIVFQDKKIKTREKIHDLIDRYI